MAYSYIASTYELRFNTTGSHLYVLRENKVRLGAPYSFPLRLLLEPDKGKRILPRVRILAQELMLKKQLTFSW
jgi:hypothetical protein